MNIYPKYIIAISGEPGVGKTTLADTLVDLLNKNVLYNVEARTYAFADALKAAALCDPRCLWTPAQVFASGLGKSEELRLFLRTIAREHQSVYGENVWVSHLEKQCIVDHVLRKEKMCDSVAIISDLRYKHEYEWLCSLKSKGVSIEIVYLTLPGMVLENLETAEMANVSTFSFDRGNDVAKSIAESLFGIGKEYPRVPVEECE
jgi:hypothetical protein